MAYSTIPTVWLAHIMGSTWVWVEGLQSVELEGSRVWGVGWGVRDQGRMVGGEGGGMMGEGVGWWGVRGGGWGGRWGVRGVGWGVRENCPSVVHHPPRLARPHYRGASLIRNAHLPRFRA